MKDETRTWLSFADENLAVARLTLEYGHLNACLQNAQQAVETYIKAMIVERNVEFRRTHSIRELDVAGKVRTFVTFVWDALQFEVPSPPP